MKEKSELLKVQENQLKIKEIKEIKET